MRGLVEWRRFWEKQDSNEKTRLHYIHCVLFNLFCDFNILFQRFSLRGHFSDWVKDSILNLMRTNHLRSLEFDLCTEHNAFFLTTLGCSAWGQSMLPMSPRSKEWLLALVESFSVNGQVIQRSCLFHHLDSNDSGCILSNVQKKYLIYVSTRHAGLWHWMSSISSIHKFTCDHP